MKQFFVIMMALCAFGITAQADDAVNAQVQDDQITEGADLSAEILGEEESAELDDSFGPRGPRRPGGVIRVPGPRFPHPVPHRPFPMPRPRPYPHPRPYPFPRPLPRPYPRPIPMPYPPFYPSYTYECSAQDAYGQIFNRAGRTQPSYLQNEVIVDCEYQSQTACVALGCRRLY